MAEPRCGAVQLHASPRLCHGHMSFTWQQQRSSHSVYPQGTFSPIFVSIRNYT